MKLSLGLMMNLKIDGFYFLSHSQDEILTKAKPSVSFLFFVDCRHIVEVLGLQNNKYVILR